MLTLICCNISRFEFIIILLLFVLSIFNRCVSDMLGSIFHMQYYGCNVHKTTVRLSTRCDCIYTYNVVRVSVTFVAHFCELNGDLKKFWNSHRTHNNKLKCCHSMTFAKLKNLIFFTVTNKTFSFRYMNSFVNPVIYTIFNPEFRKAFKRIMHIG